MKIVKHYLKRILSAFVPKKMARVGSPAVGFSLPNQDGKNVNLSDYLGKWVLLYFYPKDDTPGCIKEACGFRDSYKELQKLGIVILGVSADSVKSHKAFVKKYKLNFQLLSDESRKIIEPYGAWGLKKFMGKEYWGINRISYLINPSGVIAKKYPLVNPISHAGQIMKDVKKLIEK